MSCNSAAHEAVVNLACKLVSFPSISPTQKKATPENIAACSATLDVLEANAHNSGGICHRLVFEGGDPLYPQAIDNLLVEWDYSGGQDPEHYVVFMGHTDVVQAGEGWTTDPFVPIVADGYIQGRGVLDMKASVAAFFDGMHVLKQRVGLRYKAYAMVTTDEEWAAVNGSVKVLEWMAERGMLAGKPIFVVGEPAGVNRFGDRIAPARPGSQNGSVHIIGIPGHTAYEGTFRNPCGTILARVIDGLYEISFEDSEEWKAHTHLEVTSIIMDADPSTSIIEPGATVNFNIRFTGAYTPTRLRQMVEDAVLPLDRGRDFEIEVSFSAYPSDPYMSGDESAELEILQAVLERRFGVKAELTHMGGTSDGRFVKRFVPSFRVFEVGPPVNGVPVDHPEYGLEGGMHMKNERVAVKDLIDMRDTYVDFVLACAA